MVNFVSLACIHHSVNQIVLSEPINLVILLGHSLIRMNVAFFSNGFTFILCVNPFSAVVLFTLLHVYVHI